MNYLFELIVLCFLFYSASILIDLQIQLDKMVEQIIKLNDKVNIAQNSQELISLNYIIAFSLGIGLIFCGVYFFSTFSDSIVKDCTKVVVNNNQDNTNVVMKGFFDTSKALNQSMSQNCVDLLGRVDSLENHLGEYISKVLTVSVNNQKALESLLKLNQSELLSYLNKNAVPVEVLNDITRVLGA